MRKYFKISLSIILLVMVIFVAIDFFLNKIIKEESIISITSFSKLEYELHKASTQSLIIFDVDDVLISAVDAFANGNHIPIALKIKLLFKHPSLMLSNNWENSYSLLWDKAPRHLVDPNIPSIISSLKEKNIPTVLLTSMESGAYGTIKSFPEWRFNMLKDFGINLSGQFRNQVFTDIPKYRGNHSLLFNGILCANQESKGKVLEEFIKTNHLTPDQIFFIDDNMHNLSEVKQSCKKMNIKCRLFHFQGSSTKKINTDIALTQIDNLMKYRKWVSDFSLSEDNNLPKSYSISLDKEMHNKVGSKPPYAALFFTSKNKILFIAAESTSDLNSKTIDFIKASITNFKPELIIHEGVESSLGYLSKDIIDYISRNSSNKNNWGCGESLYSAYIANLKGYYFLGGEPDDSTVMCLLKSSHTMDDVVYFYFTRQIPQLHRQGKVNNLKEIQNYFNDFAKSIVKEYEPNYENYKSWVINHLKSFDFSILTDPENTAPIQKGSYLQKISAEIGLIRDRHVLNLISRESRNFRNILIVYDSSHFSTQYDILTGMFGLARFFKNASDIDEYFKK